MSFKIVDQAQPRLNRSELAVPGSNPSLFEKAAKSNVDVIFLDLEDAVAPDEKEQARKNIIEGLKPHGYEEGREYVVIKVPNIIDISYGRGVGYTFTEHDLGVEIHKISATNIRKEMRQKGELKEK